MKDLKTLEEQIRYNFKDKELLRIALTHSSYLNEHKGEGPDNERLEFLGDSVLDTVVSEYLFKKNKESMEGEMSFTRSVLVNTQNLSKLAQDLSLAEYMRFSTGQSKAVSASILAGSYESLVGAIYLDGGFDHALEFINSTLIVKVDEILANEPIKDAKTRFQEEAQKHISITPTYETKTEEGPDHNKHFTVKVLLDNKVIAVGQGSTKKLAEKNAAEKALAKKGW